MRNGDYSLVVAPENYPGKKYRGRYCYEHILVYWQTTGKLPPEGYIVHHKDVNPMNNSPDNLELLSIHNHNSFHSSSRGRIMLKICCPICGKVVYKERRKTWVIKKDTNIKYPLITCGSVCAGKLSYMPEQIKEKKFKENILGQYKQFLDGTITEFSFETEKKIIEENNRKKLDKNYRKWLRSVKIKQQPKNKNKTIIEKNCGSINVCKVCGRSITKGAVYCGVCYRNNEHNLSKCPSKEELFNVILSMSFTAIGNKYGVSDNAVRKWCKFYNLPYKYADIKKIKGIVRGLGLQGVVACLASRKYRWVQFPQAPLIEYLSVDNRHIDGQGEFYSTLTT